MLTLTKGRLYPGGTIWRATINGADIATGRDKAHATAEAWRTLEDLVRSQLNRVHVGVAVDGAVLTCREYSAGQYELMFHRAVALNGIRGDCGSEMGGLAIDGRPCSVYAMLERRLAQYNEAVGPGVGVRWEVK
jgi:hypothetical protein